MFESCLPGWHRVICWLDNVLHTVSRKQRDGQHRLCELHDEHLLRHMDADFANLNPKRWSRVEVTGPPPSERSAPGADAT